MKTFLNRIGILSAALLDDTLWSGGANGSWQSGCYVTGGRPGLLHVKRLLNVSHSEGFRAPAESLGAGGESV